MTWFSDVTDVALFYYVGHGQYDNDDRLCLALRDSSDDPVLRTTTSLTFDDVRHAFRVSRAATKIAILDCCFAGLAAGLHGTLAAARDLPNSSGFYLMMASDEFNTAWFQLDTEHPRPQTYFTKYLADTIERGILGQPEGLTLGPIFAQVADTLVRDGKPEPGCRASDHAARYAFARNAAPPAASGTEAAPPDAGLTGNHTGDRRATQTGEHTDTTGVRSVAAVFSGWRDRAASYRYRRQRARRLRAARRRQHEQQHQRPAGSRRRKALALSVMGTVAVAGGVTAAVLPFQPAPDLARAVLAGHTRAVTSVAFSPGGHTVASASEDGTARLWDVASHLQIGQPLSGHNGHVGSLAFSPDGHTLATANKGTTAWLWDVASHQQIVRIGEPPDDTIDYATSGTGGAGPRW